MYLVAGKRIDKFDDVDIAFRSVKRHLVHYECM